MTGPSFPVELTSQPRWVIWRRAERGPGQPQTKIPFQARDPQHRASITNPEHWASYEEAVAALSREPSGTVGGLGFVLGEGIVGIDLDKCIDEHGRVAPWARTILERLPTYTEYSPSGRGLHLIALAPGIEESIRVEGIELYTHQRYFTMTGRAFARNPVNVLTDEVSLLGADLRLIRTFLSSGKPAGVGPLWAGKGEDASAGDFALACALLQFTKGDLDLTDRLFRLSGRMREKWDERRGETTYGRMTLEKAAERVSSTGTPDTAMARLPTPISMAAWMRDPPLPPAMLIQGFLTDRELNLVGGVARSGKSTLLLEAAVSVAAGKAMFDNEGHLRVLAPGPALYVFGEQGVSLWFARASAVLAQRRLPPDIPLFFLDATGIPLSSAPQIERLASEIERLKVRLVIIDSISALFRLENQNDAAEVAEKVRGPLQRLVQATGSAVVAVHHAAKVMRKEEPMTAVDCLRGSDEFVAMAGGSVIGTWWSREYKAIKVMADIRAWGESRPFSVKFAPIPENATMDLVSPPVSALQWSGWWEDEKVVQAIVSQTSEMATTEEVDDRSARDRVLRAMIAPDGTLISVPRSVIEAKTGLSTASVGRVLLDLKNAGLIEQHAGRRGVYTLTERGQRLLLADPETGETP